jgi:hypothetical protein
MIIFKTLISKGLYARLISKENITSAIFLLKSCVKNDFLLSEDDRELLSSLNDTFNFSLYNQTIEKVQDIIKRVIEDDEFFECGRYYQFKSVIDCKPVYRPIYTTSILQYIAQISVILVLVYDIRDEKLNLNELSSSIPDNFYGNILACNSRYLYRNWLSQYKEYSQKCNAFYEHCLRSGEYQYEVNLDLIQFFERVNIEYVTEVTLQLFKNSSSFENLEQISLLTKKLLVLKVTDMNSPIEFSVGLPQGLPQSYFFGNIVMKIVSEIYNKHLTGNYLFYVDDCVIFTNEVTNDDELNSKINAINDDLRELMGDRNQIEEENKLEVHLTTDKSSITKIGEDPFKKYLSSFLTIVSGSAEDFKTAFNDSDFQALYPRFKKLHELFDREIKDINEDVFDTSNKDQNSYYKRLVRYRKFFRFREVSTSIDSADSKMEISILKRLNKKIDILGMYYYNEDYSNFFSEMYDERILQIEIEYLSKAIDKSKLKKLISQFIEIDKMIAKVGEFISNNLYLSTWLKYIEDKHFNDRIVLNFEYKGILSTWRIQKNYSDKIFQESRINLAKEIIETFEKQDFSKFLEKYFSNEKLPKNYFENFLLVTSNSIELQRRVLNALFSSIWNIPINEDFPQTYDGRTIHYLEFRIIMMLRSSNFRYDHLKRIKKILDNMNSINLDHSIINVLPYFKKYIKDALLIDDLIQIHKFVSEIWKNGSKYLHFYTLHNHEHSMTLIRNISELLKWLDGVNLSIIQFYQLFMACYLHDISMVIIPSIEAALKDKDSGFKPLDVTEHFKKSMNSVLDHQYIVNLQESDELKNYCLDTYNLIDQFIANFIRKKHHTSSAEFISKPSQILSFLDNEMRSKIANISEAHGYSTKDVYILPYTKHTIEGDFGQRMLLRLADLFDMSENRIALEILENNGNYMPADSKFHWISHKITSGYQFEVEYVFRSGRRTSIITNGVITKKVLVKIMLNSLPNNDSFVIKEDCIYYREKLTDGFKIILNGNRICSDCSFMCRWMIKKHQYLIDELFNVEEFQNSFKNSIIRTKIELMFSYLPNALPLSPCDYDAIIV